MSALNPHVSVPPEPEAAGATLAIDAFPLPLVVIDRSGSIVVANERAGRFFGWMPGELAGRPANEVLPELCPGDDAETVAGQEVLAVRRDGEKLFVQLSVAALAGSEHHVAVVRDAKTDVRMREELEKALRQVSGQTELNDLLLSALNGRVAMLDRTGTIVAVNESWREFGYNDGAGVTARVDVGINYLEICERAGTGGGKSGGCVWQHRAGEQPLRGQKEG